MFTRTQRLGGCFGILLSVLGNFLISTLVFSHQHFNNRCSVLRYSLVRTLVSYILYVFSKSVDTETFKQRVNANDSSMASVYSVHRLGNSKREKVLAHLSEKLANTMYRIS